MSPFSRVGGRPLTPGERAMATGMFGAALNLDTIRLHRAKWWPFQPRNVVMAPAGGIWFHPEGTLWREDFSTAHERLQALFVHELAHVWQHQSGLCLPFRRHVFCRYAYALTPGRRLERYGVEQQAMIVEHAFVARGAGKPDAILDQLLAEAGLSGASC
ncbi:MAG TPA: vgr related protein [Sphingomonas sp.]|nr:vgr related protein [Sphingomonas sp.]